MIKNIIDLLQKDKYYNVSERVEIAKGKYKLPSTWKESWNKIKRHAKLNKDNG